MELRHKFDLDLLLNQTNMARSSYYYHEKRIQLTDKYQSVKELIKQIYHHHKGRFGYRRITLKINQKGILINHKTVLKLMKILALHVLQSNTENNVHSKFCSVGRPSYYHFQP